MTFTKSVLRLNVTAAQKLILLAIQGERSKIISISKHCDLTGLGSGAVKRGISRLHADRLLLVEPRSKPSGHYAANRYILNIEGISDRASMDKKDPRAWCKKDPPYIYSRSRDPETSKKTQAPEDRSQGNVVEFSR